jgi:hypothetical protein
MSSIPRPLKHGPSDRSVLDDQRAVNTLGYPKHKIAPAVVLEAFAEVIVFQRIFVTMTGSVTAALMLSHAIELSNNLGTASTGWFDLSQDQWHEQTGLSRFEQSVA